MGSLDLPIEFNVEISTLPRKIREDTEQTLWDLAEDHHDMTGASITISRPAHGETPYLYRVSIVVYMRPDNVYADEKSDNLEAAFKGAMAAIVRQVRERRDKLGEPWKRPDVSSEESPPPELE
jgi:ribosome-associated translation inhibitor RaiA